MKKNLKSNSAYRSKLKIRVQAWFAYSTIVLLALLLFACHTKETAQHDTYTCPMHPTVISDKPGTCPVCAMDLVRKAREGEEVKITEDLVQSTKSPNEVVIASVKTVKAEHRALPVALTVQGIVTYDTRYTYTIPARVGGRLEKVYIKYAFQPVHKGQKIAEIYSPELLAAQRELLYLVKNDASNTLLIESAKSKLYLLGATQQQVDNLVRQEKISNTFTIYSPYDGYVIGESNVPATTPATSQSASGGGMGDAMGGIPVASGSNAAAGVTSSSILREGTYVSTGATLFRVVNTSALRIELDLPIQDTDLVKKGDAIELDLGNTGTQKATIDFVQPFFNQQENFIKARVYLKNTSLPIGQFVKATVFIKAKEALWLPKESVQDLGLQKIVFIKDRGVFKPQPVTTGVIADNFVMVKGISSADEIAANAQYLVDSESFIKTND
jgi:membrane fusion protein, copper/silver efflux system